MTRRGVRTARLGLGTAVLACTLALAAAPATWETVDQAAHATEQQAVARGCAWSVTETLLAQAATLHRQGQDAAALAAATRAATLAQLSLKQCDEQETAWHQAVVR